MLALLNACNSSGTVESAATVAPAPAVSDEPVILGAPFIVGSVTHKPQDIPAYDEVGYARLYIANSSTANGEPFKPMAATAAHKTLPMPSYVEVTALDTGRTILVRINDRGPMANDRLIDLSEGAVRQLGISAQHVVGVRVRRVNPPEQEKEVLRQGTTAAERIETPELLLKVLRDNLAKQLKPVAVVEKAEPIPAKDASKPAPVVSVAKTKPTPNPVKQNAVPGRVSGGSYVVQVAALSSRANADAVARKLGASVAKTADGRLFRVRYGPYRSEAEAQQGLANAKARGYPQARIYHD